MSYTIRPFINYETYGDVLGTFGADDLAAAMKFASTVATRKRPTDGHAAVAVCISGSAPVTSTIHFAIYAEELPSIGTFQSRALEGLVAKGRSTLHAAGQLTRKPAYVTF